MKINVIKQFLILDGFHFWLIRAAVLLHIAGKFDGENIWQIYSIRALLKSVVNE